MSQHSDIHDARLPGERDLQAYVDGQLSGGRRAEIEDWLTDHPEEAVRLADLRGYNLGLQSLASTIRLEPPDNSLVDSSEQLGTALRRHRRIRQMGAGMLMSTVLLSASGLAWYGVEHLRPVVQVAEYVPAPGVGLTADQRLVVDPVQAATPTPVGLWLAREAVVAPDLRELNFDLVEARAGPLAVWLLYERAGGDKALLRVGPAAATDLADHGLSEGGLALSWRQGEIVYRLTTTLPPDQLPALFHAVQTEMAPPPVAIQEARAETVMPNVAPAEAPRAPQPLAPQPQNGPLQEIQGPGKTDSTGL